MTDRKTLGDRIDGNGYSKEPLDGDELAKGRQRNGILDREFVSPDSLVDALSPSAIAKLAKRLNIGLWHGLVQFVTQYKVSLSAITVAVAGINYQEIAAFIKLFLGAFP